LICHKDTREKAFQVISQAVPAEQARSVLSMMPASFPCLALAGMSAAIMAFTVLCRCVRGRNRQMQLSGLLEMRALSDVAKAVSDDGRHFHLWS
jgi:hypothetical protein